VQGSEWRRDLERTFSHSIDGVAAGAIIQRERLAALFRGRRGQCRRRQQQRNERETKA
jgi:hypothetical protein